MVEPIASNADHVDREGRAIVTNGIRAGAQALAGDVARLNLVRIGLGLVLLERYGSNARALLRLPSTCEQLFTIGFLLTAAFLLTVGLLTPIVAAALFLFQWHADQTLSSWSLSSMVVQMLCVVATFLPAGTTLSIDSWLVPRSALMRRVYAVWGAPTAERTFMLRAMAFVSYAVVSLSAVQFHLSDRVWRSGFAQLYIFANPYWSSHASAFRSVAEKFPIATLFASRLMTAAMLAWEAFMLPLALSGRAGRRVVAAYGVTFFAMSAALLQLAWLPYFEMLLWILVFWTRDPIRLPRGLPTTMRLRLGGAAYALGVAGALVAMSWIGAVNRVHVISEHFGMAPTDVFNTADLQVNETYATIARIGSDKRETLLPFNAPDGGRLAWHASERLYYGVSLKWRRAHRMDGARCWKDSLDRGPLEQVIDFDRRSGGPPNSRYAVTFYSDPLPDVAHVKDGTFRFETSVRCRVVYDPARASAR